MFGFDRSRALAGAHLILEQGGWCVLEVCADVPSQRWDAMLVIFVREAEAVADIVAAELISPPQCDARLRGCDRQTLAPRPAMGTYLCSLAATAPAVRRTGARGGRTSKEGIACWYATE